MDATEKNRRHLELTGKLNSAAAEHIARTAIELHEEYLKTDSFKEYLHTTFPDFRPDPAEFRDFAESRIKNDLRTALYTLQQEGTIAPMNVWRRDEELLRGLLANDADRKIFWGLMHGTADLCIHTRENSPMKLLSQIFGGFPFSQEDNQPKH